MQFHADLVRVGGLAVAADAHVAGSDAFDAAVFMEQHFGRSEAGENLHAQRFGLLAHPAHHVAEADHVVAVVLETFGQQCRRNFECTGFTENHETVFADRRIERRVFFFPVGNQFIQRDRVHHRAGEDVRTDFRAFFEHADTDFAVLFRSQLFQTNCRTEAGRTGTDDDDVIFHGFAFGHFSLHVDDLSSDYTTPGPP